MSFEQFWSSYPRRIAKYAARQSYEKALRHGANPDEIISGVENYKKHLVKEETPERFIAHASTWLNQGRWEDEYTLNLPQQEAPMFHVGETMSQAKRRWERQGKAFSVVS